MLHEPAAVLGKDPAFARKRRLGVVMFLIYAAVYAAFTAVNVLSPRSMETPILGGQNVAVVYGFGLIVLAFLMALVYNAACGRFERSMAEGVKP